jgi:hypothetical protein
MTERRVDFDLALHALLSRFMDGSISDQEHMELQHRLQSAGGRFFSYAMPAVGLPLESRHEYALIAGMIELKFTGGAESVSVQRNRDALRHHVKLRRGNSASEVRVV